MVEQIIESSGTPFFAFKDLDENRSIGSIRIRIETIDYFLRRYWQQVVDLRRARAAIERQLAAYERELRAELDAPASSARRQTDCATS